MFVNRESEPRNRESEPRVFCALCGVCRLRPLPFRPNRQLRRSYPQIPWLGLPRKVLLQSLSKPGADFCSGRFPQDPAADSRSTLSQAQPGEKANTARPPSGSDAPRDRCAVDPQAGEPH